MFSSSLANSSNATSHIMYSSQSKNFSDSYVVLVLSLFWASESLLSSTSMWGTEISNTFWNLSFISTHPLSRNKILTSVRLCGNLHTGLILIHSMCHGTHIIPSKFTLRKSGISTRLPSRPYVQFSFLVFFISLHPVDLRKTLCVRVSVFVLSSSCWCIYFLFILLMFKFYLLINQLAIN